MNNTLILVIALLAAMANLADWVVTRRGSFCWNPAGPVWTACNVAVGVTAVAVLLEWTEPWVMFLVMTPPFIFLHLGSIWLRHASPAPVA